MIYLQTAINNYRAGGNDKVFMDAIMQSFMGNPAVVKSMVMSNHSQLESAIGALMKRK